MNHGGTKTWRIENRFRCVELLVGSLKHEKSLILMHSIHNDLDTRLPDDVYDTEYQFLSPETAQPSRTPKVPDLKCFCYLFLIASIIIRITRVP